MRKAREESISRAREEEQNLCWRGEGVSLLVGRWEGDGGGWKRGGGGWKRGGGG